MIETEKSLPITAPFAFRSLRWEDQPPGSGRPQERLNPMARVCTVFAGLLADRWGSQTGAYSSGFEEEYMIARDRYRASSEGFPDLWLFFSEVEEDAVADRAQYEQVVQFKAEIKDDREALIAKFGDLKDLEDKLRRAFQRLVGTLLMSLGPNQTGLIGNTSQDIRTGPITSAPRAPKSDERPQERPSKPLPADWHEALVAEPLEDSGMAEQEREARDLEESDPAGAAAVYVEVSHGLLSAGYSPLADIYSDRASALYKQVGDNAKAAEVLVDALRRAVLAMSERAPYMARRLLELTPEDQRWRSHALEALADWPGGLLEATDHLAVAIQRLDSDGTAPDDDERLQFTAGLVELLCVGERFADALQAADEVRDVPLAIGHRLQIALDYMDAEEAIHGVDRADMCWEQIREFVHDLGDDASDAAAIAWQRRGVTLAGRGRVSDAREAFRRAVQRWRQRRGYDDQVREAYFASQIAGGLNGEFSTEGEAIRPWAANLRGDADTPARRADRFEEHGMSYRLHKQFPDSLRSYWLAYTEHRRAGNLRGAMFCMELLGELNVTADHPSDAVWAYVRAGREKEAADAARTAPVGELGSALDVGDARWRRAASYSVIAAVGRQLAPEILLKIQAPIIAEAKRDVQSLVGPEPIVRAQEALAAIVFGVEPDVQDEAIGRLRELALDMFIGTTRPAVEALILLTNAEVSDETETLLKAFLDDSGLRGISPIWLGGRLSSHPDAADAIVARAKTGARDALEVAACAGLPEHDGELAAACANSVQIVIDSQPMETVQEDGRSYRRVGMGGYEMSGVLAKFCPEPMRVGFAEKMAAITGDNELPLMNRASAASALFNVATALDSATARRLAGEMVPIVAGEVERSDWDYPDEADAFSRFQMNQPGAWYLQGSALAAWSALRHDADDDQPGDKKVITDALAAGAPFVMAAAIDALTRMPHVPLPGAVGASLTHPDSQVRAAAVSTSMHRNQMSPPEPVLSRLVDDEAVNVRLTILANADQLALDARTALLTRFINDPDAYVRAFAGARLRSSRPRFNPTE
ncbi:MAG TPA: hypothetical protein VIJ39_07090 [Solirubrobacteraceae bacterium]